MKVSIFTRIYNRAHLLKYSLEALHKQIGPGIEVDVHVADSNSSDGLVELLPALSRNYRWKFILYQTRHLKDHFKHTHNCPAAHYNVMVAMCESPYIIKVDPEFVFITDGFIQRGLEILSTGRPAIIMPLPHHVGEFAFNSLKDIKTKWRDYEYSTHINRQTAATSNVYYGCIFNRQAYIDLGGIDLRFGQGIGSEDDHFLDQWRRRYGPENVITLLEEEGLHMWHGGFSAGVPQELYRYVDANAALRVSLRYEYPNGGNFSSIKYPDIRFDAWENGEPVAVNCVKRMSKKGEEINEGFVIGHVNRE